MLSRYIFVRFVIISEATHSEQVAVGGGVVPGRVRDPDPGRGDGQVVDGCPALQER